ncbi:MAG: phosphatase PAP2 family protein [Rhizobiaceae bacterium]
MSFRGQLFVVTAVSAIVAALLFLSYPELDKLLVNLLRGEDGLIVEAPASVASARVQLQWFVGACYGSIALLWLGSLVRRDRLIGLFPAEWFYIILCGLTGPLLIVDGILKKTVGRPRPRMVDEFSEGLLYGKDMPFVGALRPGGLCPTNCSFVAGEVAVTVMLFASILMVSERYRVVFGILLLAGWAVSGFIRYRMLAHFPSDILFAGFFMIMIAAILHWLMFSVLDLRRLFVRSA